MFLYIKKVIISLILIGFIIQIDNYLFENSIFVDDYSIHAENILTGISLENGTPVFEEDSLESSILRTYSAGTELRYTMYNENWYSATIFIEGKSYRGYISKDNVETIETSQQSSITGYSKDNSTVIYSKASRTGAKLRTYGPGSLLSFQSFSTEWYKARIFADGKWQVGYINHNDVELYDESTQVSARGIAKNPTFIYSKPSTHSSRLRSYPEGVILNFKTFSNDWYIATIFQNGKGVVGYIHKGNVETLDLTNQLNLRGISKGVTPVYVNPSRQANVLRRYTEGHILSYKTFSKNWYVAEITINNRQQTVYINHSDVDNVELNSNIVHRGLGISNPVNIYTRPAKNSQVIRTYEKGTILRYQPLTSNWYEATIYIEGEERKGYISTDDVENLNSEQENLSAYASKNKLYVFQRASRNSRILRSYNKGQLLRFKTFSNNWYEAVVTVDGQQQTGYINKEDVSFEPLRTVNYVEYNYTLSRMIDIQMGVFPQTDLYRNVSPWIENSSVFIENGIAYLRGEITAANVNLRSQPNTTSSITRANGGDEFMYLGNVTGTEVNGSRVWYKIKVPRNDNILYVHSSLASYYSIQYYESSSKNSHLYGRMTFNSTNVLETNAGWSRVSNRPTWRNSKRDDVERYVNPSKQDEFQFIDLSSSINVSATQLNQLLTGKGVLEGKGASYIEASKKHGVNEAYLIAHSILESGHGTSTLATGVKVGLNSSGTPTIITGSESGFRNVKTVYNMYGIGANDINPLYLGAVYAYNRDWTSVDKAIIEGAAFVSDNYFKRNQTTLYKMRWNPQNPGTYQYATDIGWASKQVDRMKDIYSQLQDPKLVYEIPVYK